MTGLSLLTPPLCCDPDVYAAHVHAHTLASMARVLAPDAIDGATSLRALDGAVQEALLASYGDADDAARSAYTPRSRAGRDHARAMERLRSAWCELVPVLRADVALATHAPATAGAAHVDADGREVSP